MSLILAKKVFVDIKVRERLRSYFNPDGFKPSHFRMMMATTLMNLVLAEVTVYVLLQQSAHLGELPSYITDVLIISISAVEFLLGPFVGWLGSQRRRTVVSIWVLIALGSVLPVFGVPKPVTEADTPLCNSNPMDFVTGISTKAGVRLFILILAAISCALTRLALTAHTLAYLDEFHPSANLHLNVGVVIVARAMALHVAPTLIRRMLLLLPWIQLLLITMELTFTSVKLHKYPVVAPTVERRLGSDRALFRSIGRVLRSKMAVLQILAMSLLAAAMWGFSSQNYTFTKTKYHVVHGDGLIWEINAPVRGIFLVLGVVLVGYMYTKPVMATYDKKKAIRNGVRMSIFSMIIFIVMTAAFNCETGTMAGLEPLTYSQPACGIRCGCDRPWAEFSPVCATDTMTTYFSPCHAGCATIDDIGGFQSYSNCACAPNGRVTVGACSDNSCVAGYTLHALLLTVAVLTSVLAFSWQTTVVLESVDKRDISVAVGVASSFVALFAFVGAHGVYMGISAFTCAQYRGNKCLFQNSKYIPWVGYTSVALAAASVLVSIISAVVYSRQTKGGTKEIEDNANLNRE